VLQVADAGGALLECRDYLAPIITPHEALLALTDQPFEPERYTLGFDSVLAYKQQQRQQRQQGGATAAGAAEGGASRRGATAAAAELGGNIRTEEEFEEMGAGAASSSSCGQAVALSSQQQLQVMRQAAAAGKAVVVKTAAQYLAVKRSYQGLETPLTGAQAKAPELAAAGRTGRAAVYQGEPGS
jgi:diphthamide biosynthesis protein 2